jgi:hypothetical protein
MDLRGLTPTLERRLAGEHGEPYDDHDDEDGEGDEYDDDEDPDGIFATPARR